jgi:hypothetical protein
VTERKPGFERRRAPRIGGLHGDCPISVVGAQLVSVSPYGMRIESRLPMEPDAVMPVRIVVAGEKIDVLTRVAACSAAMGGRKGLFGIGLEFMSLPGEIRRKIEAALGLVSQ